MGMSNDDYAAMEEDLANNRLDGIKVMVEQAKVLPPNSQRQMEFMQFCTQAIVHELRALRIMVRR